MNKIHSIVNGAGGARAVAKKTGLKEDAVRKWWGANSHGIPDRYWRAMWDMNTDVREHEGYYIVKLYDANREDRT